MVGSNSKQIHQGFFVCTFFLLCWYTPPSRAENSELDQIEFDYSKWSTKGPEHWGELKKEWVACKNGRSQSPIDLRDVFATKVNSSLENFQVSYKPANAIMKNEGHTIAAMWEGDAGSIRINGIEYTLESCHWHHPSEHTINGKRYDLELHMVHKSKDDKDVAVVGFLYKIGKPDPFISMVIKVIASMTDMVNKVHLGVIDPNMMRKAQIRDLPTEKFSSIFYRYMGSLTTPPCTEGVTWMIKKQVQTVSTSQLKLIQAVFDYGMMNARPLQPLNIWERDIKLPVLPFNE